MKFGELPVAEALGAVLVHTTRAGELVLKKGRVLRREDLTALLEAGIATVIGATLEEEDVAEDDAARHLALAVAGDGTRLDPAKTGRCNVFAGAAGLCTIDTAEIARINAVDERLTVATIAADTPVRAGDMVATVKIIPFSVPGPLLEEAARRAVRDPDRTSAVRDLDDPGSVRDPARRPDVPISIPAPIPTPGAASAASAAPVRVHPWLGRRAGLILTRFAETHPSLLARAEAAQRERMMRCGGEVVERRIVAHHAGEVAQALRELAHLGLDPILALGASAIMDRRDVIPSAIEQVGGTLVRFGMPVDPGNLLLLATLPAPTGVSGGAPGRPVNGPASGPVNVIGVPSCARSLKRSGFDWVLERCCAGIPISSSDIARLGVGGLLDEIELRPAPRKDGPGNPAAPRIAAVVLAAGLGSRMEPSAGAKLLAPLEGKPMVRWAVEAALASRARPVVVVTGHRADEVTRALEGLPGGAVTFVHNPDYAQGMASSLRAGIGRAADADAAVVCLGDMPRVTAAHIDRLIDAFDPGEAPIVVPTHQRKRGNPVLWARRFFAEIEALRGDVGARALLDRHAGEVCLLAIDDPAILLDVDTPQALEQLRGARST